eukprot:TRINITY_DN27667_c0_g1_i1.p1 TRINITY_DN27667_c0_g1~~TRINITY_DN27667_c0_g1_i1.p1  ORF type:complete len:498 (+),score=94.47 TRINITY_DN27667_c0_g1_i1:94-1587(+)
MSGNPCCSGICHFIQGLLGGAQGQRLAPAKSSRHSNVFIVDNQGKVSDFYDVDTNKLGAGSYGTVSKAVHKTSKSIRAIKAMRRSAPGGQQQKFLDRLNAEIQIMKKLDHPSIIKLFETFQDKTFIYLAMELCTGGELFDRIVEAVHFTESQAAVVMKQMISAIYYLHVNGIVHRDLKPENFLFQTKDPIEKNLLKLIDFGLATEIVPGQVMHTKSGTPYYVAPQVLRGSYDQQCDVWSCGVIMYVLLCGYPPFWGDTDADVLSKVRLGNFTFNAADWNDISSDAKELIRRLLKFKPEERFTANQALQHVWIKERAPRAAKQPLTKDFVSHLRQFRTTNKFKRAALQVIATQLSEEKIANLRKLFLSLDANGDGMLTVKEIQDGLKDGGIYPIPPDVQKLIESMDCDGSGAIDYSEFLAATVDAKMYGQEDVLWSAFCVFDRNGDGKISQDELRKVLETDSVNEVVGAEAVQEIMREIDADGNGEIDFKEFIQMMRK